MGQLSLGSIFGDRVSLYLSIEQILAGDLKPLQYALNIFNNYYNSSLLLLLLNPLQLCFLQLYLIFKVLKLLSELSLNGCSILKLLFTFYVHFAHLFNHGNELLSCLFRLLYLLIEFTLFHINKFIIKYLLLGKQIPIHV